METKKEEIEVRRIRENIIILTFSDQTELTSTFLRFQEYYESPEFQGKVFSLNEYKEWYIKIKGDFTYYTDWSGFNIPSHVLKVFREGLFNPLSEKENNLLTILKNIPEPSYIIALYKGLPDIRFKSILKHEIAHALFSLDSEYRNKVLSELSQYDLTVPRKLLMETGGYAESVLDDELNAYAISDSLKIPKSLFGADLVASLESLYEAYS